MDIVRVLARRMLRVGTARTFVVVAVLILASGSAMFGAAGGRRTATAYDRFVAWSDPADVVTAGFPGDRPVADLLPQVEALPEVVRSGRFKTIEASSFELPGGRVVSPPRLNVAALGDAQLGRTTSRVKVLEGRLPDAASSTEAVIDFTTAGRFELDVGDDITMFIRGGENPAMRPTVRIAGIISSPDGFPTVSGWADAVLVLMPGFVAAHPDWVDPYAESLLVHLRDGPDPVQDFKRALTGIGLGDMDLANDLATSRDGALPVTRLEAGGLWAAAALAALTGLVVLYQLLRRETTAIGPQLRDLRALGVRRAELVAAATARGCWLGGIGAAGASILAILLSPLAPVGLARAAEVDTGFHADLVVLGVGALSIVLAAGLLSAAAMLAATRPSRHVERSRRPSRRLTWLPPWVVAGTAMSVGAGAPTASARRRAGLAGGVASIGLLSMTLVVLVGLTDVADEPSRSGASWDAFVLVEDPDVALTAEDVLREVDAVDGVSRGGWTGLESGDEAVFSLVVGPNPELAPTITRGRAPAANDEVALGQAAMERLGTHLGDSLEVAIAPSREAPDLPRTAQVEVVGETIVSSTLFLDFAPDDAAVMTPELSQRIEGDAEGEMPFLVSFRSGVLPQAGLDAVHEAVGDGGIAFSFASSERGDVRAVEELSAVLRLLAALVIVVVAASLLHNVVVSIGQNRRDLAILRGIGFRRPQLLAAGGASGTIIASIAIVLGVPLGVAAGRGVWRQVAAQLIVVPGHTVPLGGLAIVMGAAALAATAVGAAAVSRATSKPPAVVLRSE